MTTSKQLTVVDSIKKMEPEFRMALPKHIPAERFTRNALTAINSNPDLLRDDVDRRSLYSAVMKAAQDGLVLDNREAALVTFFGKDGKKVQYMPMVAGVLKKMRNTGEIATISTGLVYRNEYDQGRFRYVKGDTESLTHDPILFEDKGDLIGVYAVVTLKDGAKIREFMDMGQIAKVRNASRSKDGGPWKTWFEEMCLKSVLRRVSKLCPMASDLDGVFSSDDEESTEDEPALNVVNEVPANQPTEATPKRQTRAASTVKAKAPEPEQFIDIEHEELPLEDDIPA